MLKEGCFYVTFMCKYLVLKFYNIKLEYLHISYKKNLHLLVNAYIFYIAILWLMRTCKMKRHPYIFVCSKLNISTTVETK